MLPACGFLQGLSHADIGKAGHIQIARNAPVQTLAEMQSECGGGVVSPL